MAGYAVDTIDPAKAGLHCCECELILKEAVQTWEGHRMCKDCFDAIKKSPGFKSAKTDISILDEDGKPFCYPDNAVRREVKKLVVSCKNKKYGCDFVGDLDNYFKMHINACDFKPVECPNKAKGCSEMLAPGDLQKHVSEECQFRRIKCKYCGEDTENHLLHEHNEICLKFPLECSLCTRTVDRDQMPVHEERYCPKLKCICGKILSREGDGEGSMSAHLKHPSDVMAHIMSVMTYSKSVKDVLKILEKRISKLESATSRPMSPQHAKMSQETTLALKSLEERLTPLEVLHKTMGSGNTQTDKNIEVLQKMLKDMEAKSKQQEAQIIAFKAQLEQRNVASSWESSRVSSRGNNSGDTTRVLMVEKKYEDLERQVASLKVHVSELELQLQASLASTHNGTFLWRIPEVARRKRDAIEERVTSIYSPPFYTGRNGYKICVRAYLNGDGIGYNTHLSLFFVMMKGEFDPLLKWPFDNKVSLILVDQNHRKHIVQTFRPTTESSSFQRPISDMNVASGCPQFAKLTVLEDENYTKDDVIFIKCLIDTSKIFHP